ncbi:pyrophosphatase PpaX [Symbiobacterium terraclitae]|uniref:Pyrophosphatase PpaX n=1 Tax=Symbiobacterium terraclitae TaxID=557451 RepID=A0ABS4JTT4_9FIRM|nr:pyrophosphatase PpaX [Symbiobacterium terraclitae]MBP2018360.1 pyrophosphatase PpaX [Symbiobacterium terraclitae]
MRNFDAVLFDLDGTLIDTNQLIVESFQHVFRSELGLEVTPAEIYPYFGEPLHTTLARYGPDRADELVAAYRKFNLSQHDRMVRPFPGVAGAVADLQAAGVRLGVVTSKITELALRGLRVCGIADYFPVVVGVDQTQRHKPEPDPALRAIALLGVEPGPRVLMVGDSPFDIACGRAAGCMTAAVGWAANPAPLAACRPDFWIEQPADLVTVVTGPAGGDCGSAAGPG